MVGDFVCNVCGKQFIAKRALYLHMRGVHTEVEVPCNDCDKIFKSKTKLEYHTRATHQEKNSFYCDVKLGDTCCIYYSATKSNLRAHKKRVHEKTLPNPPELVCGSCDYRTNRKFNLDTHSEKCKISDRSPINHSCNLCNKTFSCCREPLCGLLKVVATECEKLLLDGTPPPTCPFFLAKNRQCAGLHVFHIWYFWL